MMNLAIFYQGIKKKIHLIQKWGLLYAHPNSEHLYGNAIDFLIIGHPTQDVSKVLAEYWKGRWYYEYGFIHADSTKSRGVRADW